jgi:hypothetical protein
LLDTYAAERRPVAARVLHNTRAQVAELMELDQVKRYLAEMIAAVDVRYDLPGAGWFVPDLTLRTGTGGSVRVRDLFGAGRTVLLDLADDPFLRETAAGWAGRLDVVTGQADGVAEPLLVRPDGYVAWAGAGDLGEALTRNLGTCLQTSSSG